MPIKGLKRKFGIQEILTEEEIEAIHRGTLRVLAETGVAVFHEKALKLYADAGCMVDFNTNRVRFPQWLVEQTLAKCPSVYRVKARNPENDMILSGEGDVTYFSPSCGMNTVDLDTWKPRVPTRKEFYDFVKVCDALPHVHMQACFPYFGFDRLPQAMSLIESCAGKIRYSDKVQMEGWVLDNYRWTIEMCKATGQDIFCLGNPGAPLTYSKEQIDNLIYTVESDMVLHFASGVVAGATGPSTLAGAIIADNANAIPGMVLAQIIRPGARIWLGNMIFVQNMVTGSPAFGAIENSLIVAGYNQLLRRYKIPNWSITSGFVSSKTIDYQAGYETALAALIAVNSGSSMVFLQGGLTAQLTAHPVKAILDDDIAGMVERYLGGIEVTDETMAVDLINEVGPIPGHFLNKAHTRMWWKKEQFLPRVDDRLSYPEWVQKGQKNAIDHARERMEQILATHKPNLLTPQQEQTVEDILKEARNYYRKNGMISDEEWKAYQEDLNSPHYPFA